MTRKRASSPKLQVLNTALMTAPSGWTLSDALADRAQWGRLVESCVGAHLANAEAGGECKIWYWREGNLEVDFVVETPRKMLTTIEVKSGRTPNTHRGMEAFDGLYHPARKLFLGEGGIPIEDFLAQSVGHWIDSV